MKIVYRDKYAESCKLKDKYSELLDKLKSVDDGTTIGELVSLLGTNKLIIVAGNNSSGIDIIDLTDEEIDEWTW